MFATARPRAVLSPGRNRRGHENLRSRWSIAGWHCEANRSSLLPSLHGQGSPALFPAPSGSPATRSRLWPDACPEPCPSLPRYIGNIRTKGERHEYQNPIRAGRITVAGDIVHARPCGTGGDGSNLSLNLKCASDSYNFNLTSDVEYQGGAIRGSWTEASRNASGTISGRASGS